MNKSISVRAFLTVFLLTCCAVSGEAPPERRQLTGKPWIDMDYGPYLTATLEVSPGNIANKALAIRLDDGVGSVSAGHEFVIFDTDTLRFAAGWIGDRFIDWKNIAMDGQHEIHASIVGFSVFTNPDAPGWASPRADFEDQRIIGRDDNRYGPVPRDWAHWKGLYLHGNNVVLSYTVGNTPVLELPNGEGPVGDRAMTRTLNVGARTRELIVQVAHHTDSRFALHDYETDAPNKKLAVLVPPTAAAEDDSPEAPARDILGFDGQTSVEITGSDEFDMTGSDFTVFARIKTTEDGTIFAKAPRDGDWQPNAKALFVRSGQLCYDIGWVGAVQTEQRVNDGKWHDVGMTWKHVNGEVRLFVDGKLAATGNLKPNDETPEHTARIGFASPNFPEDSAFVGQIEEVRFYKKPLGPTQLSKGRLPDGDALVGHWNRADAQGQTVPDTSGHGHDGTKSVAASDTGIASWPKPDKAITCLAVLGGPQDTEWVTDAEEHLRLRIPAGGSTKLKIVYGRIADAEDVEPFVTRLRSIDGPIDLEPLTRGGPRRWTKTVTTKSSVIGDTDGPFVAENITTPLDNPYRSWMRLGGFDFFADGRRAAVCTWQGDVWIVDGIEDELGELKWTRIASGMFQPLGLKIVDEDIYVTCRDQITLLRDLNGDGETDFYENFNNDAQVTEHFHEFAMDLQTDAEGNFYYAKAARHAKDALVPQHGTLLRVSKDGQTTEIIAGGFRAPDGVCVNGDGSFVLSDQEGHWTPQNRINWVVPGGFYGNMMAYHEGRRPNEFDKPVLWIHREIDRSPTEQLWVTSDQWQPLKGALLNLSYGTGQIHNILLETVGDTRQGGIVRLPIVDFPTGIMRGRFHPSDGDLYVCGLFGWSSDKTLTGGFYRVRYTGKPLHLPIQLQTTRRGMIVTFTNPLDPETAGDYGNYAVSRWNYRRAPSYGSQDYRVSSRRRTGRDRVRVEDVLVSRDKRSVLLEIRDMRPSMQMEIRYNIKAADGTELSQVIQNTIHTVGEAPDFPTED